MEYSYNTLVILGLAFCCFSGSVASSSTPTNECFPSCSCDDKWHIACVADTTFVQNVPEFNRHMLLAGTSAEVQVHFITGSNRIPSFIQHLPVVHDLSLAGNSISVVQTGAFSGMRLHKLNLSRNAINIVQPGSFSDLIFLRTLDLSYNGLTSLAKNVFSQMPALQVLNLDHNELQFFPFDMTSVVPNLRELTLNFNKLTYLMPSHLFMLPSLSVLRLHGNKLDSFLIHVAEEVPSLEELDVAGNPFHCSCGVRSLQDLAESNVTKLLDAENTVCASPPTLVGKRVVDVSPLTECTEPTVFQDYNSRKVLYTSDVELGCDVSGDPHPAILWHTPWGHQFAAVSHFAKLENICSDCKPHRRYRGIGISLISEVSVLSEGRILRITSFRGFFDGNITCTAYNFVGNNTATRHVEVFSGVPTACVNSLVIGGFSAAGFLSLGLVIGSIKLTVLACRKRFGPKNILHSPGPMSQEEKAPSVVAEGDCREDDMDLDDEFYPPETPFTTPVAASPSASPEKVHTPPDEDAPPGGWLPSSIFDTMDEVRWRLRYGVGRKMTAVKKNVKSMKESGSVYVHNIMETGSTAAHKVRAGVVMGMETVKYHVQSIKEFCGTGDMGTQTISMVSVETNIDTNESREVVKSVTIV